LLIRIGGAKRILNSCSIRAVFFQPVPCTILKHQLNSFPVQANSLIKELFEFHFFYVMASFTSLFCAVLLSHIVNIQR
jgi:hypothetical protein